MLATSHFVPDVRFSGLEPKHGDTWNGNSEVVCIELDGLPKGGKVDGPMLEEVLHVWILAQGVGLRPARSAENFLARSVVPNTRALALPPASPHLHLPRIPP